MIDTFSTCQSANKAYRLIFKCFQMCVAISTSYSFADFIVLSPIRILFFLYCMSEDRVCVCARAPECFCFLDLVFSTVF